MRSGVLAVISLGGIVVPRSVSQQEPVSRQIDHAAAADQDTHAAKIRFCVTKAPMRISRTTAAMITRLMSAEPVRIPARMAAIKAKAAAIFHKNKFQRFRKKLNALPEHPLRKTRLVPKPKKSLK